MFGFNAGIINHFQSFYEFNAWRKNQLLRYCGTHPEVYDSGRHDDNNNHNDNNDDNDCNNENNDEKKSNKQDQEPEKPWPSIHKCLTGIVPALSQAKGTSKFRDYCKFIQKRANVVWIGFLLCAFFFVTLKLL